MKNYEKLLIVMLVITVITSILTVSVCAEETYVLPKGEWVGKDIINYGNTTSWLQKFNFTTANGDTYTGACYGNSGTYSSLMYRYNSGVSFAYHNNGKGWVDGMRTIYTTEAQTVTKDCYEWVTTYFDYIEPLCDGSTCPATDANMDNVCDDCGMTFAVLRSYPDPEGWPSNIPSPPAQYESFTILTENGNTWLYMANGGLSSIRLSDADTSGKRTLIFYLNGTYPTSNLQRYRLDGDEWVYNSVGSLTSFSFDETLDFTYTTVDIIDAKGDVVFPLPLWAEIQTIAQGEVTQTSAEVHSVMMTLTLCGVGLIALLVCLTLFGKRSLIFRKY